MDGHGFRKDNSNEASGKYFGLCSNCTCNSWTCHTNTEACADGCEKDAESYPERSPENGVKHLLHRPTQRFSVGRERHSLALIKLTKPFDPVKSQSLHKNNESFK